VTAFEFGDKVRVTIDAAIYGKADAGGRTIYDLLFDDQVIIIDPDVDTVDMALEKAGRPEFYSVPDLVTRTGLSKSTIYRMVEADQIPGTVRFSPRVLRFHAATFDAWLAEQVGRVSP